MNHSPIQFTATGTIQTYRVPQSGRYVIEASGAQGGTGGGPGGKGARLRGTFTLAEGDILHILVGRQGSPGTAAANGVGNGSSVFEKPSAGLQPEAAGGGGGGSFVWKSDDDASFPLHPMLAAGGGGGGSGSNGTFATDGLPSAAPGGRDGHGGSADWGNLHYSGGAGAGWLTVGAQGSAPTFCGGGTRWAGGIGARYNGREGGSGGFGGGGGGAFVGFGSGGGGGYSGGGGGTQHGPGGGGGGSYNDGENQRNFSGIQAGDGSVSLRIESPEEAVSRVDEPAGLLRTLPDFDETTATVSDTAGVPSWNGSDPGVLQFPASRTVAGGFPSLLLWNAAYVRMARKRF